MCDKVFKAILLVLVGIITALEIIVFLSSTMLSGWEKGFTLATLIILGVAGLLLGLREASR